MHEKKARPRSSRARNGDSTAVLSREEEVGEEA